MKSITTLLIFIFFFVSGWSCSHTDHHNSSEQSHSHQPSVSRRLASQQKFDALVAKGQDAFTNSMNQAIELFSKAFLKAQFRLEEFDRTLNNNLAANRKGGSTDELMASLNYRRLIALRIYKERLIEEFGDLYSELLRRLVNSPRGSAERALYTSLIRPINRALNPRINKGIEHQFIYDELFQEIQRSVAQINQESDEKEASLQNESTDVQRVTKEEIAASKSLLSGFTSMFSTSNRKEVIDQIKSSRRNLEAAIGRVKDLKLPSIAEIQIPSLEEIQNKVDAEFWAPDRSPNSKANSGFVCVTPDPNGNITGNAFKIGDNPTEGVWSITYDDGPHKTRSIEIANMYKEANERNPDNKTVVTYFWLAKNAKAYPEVVDTIKAMDTNYVELANHSYTHANLAKASGDQLVNEISGSSDYFRSAYGPNRKLKFFRLPYGAGVKQYSEARKLIAKEGMIHTFWNVDSLDWQDKDPESVFERVKKQIEIKKKGIILFHDIHDQTVKATRKLLDYIKEQRAKGQRFDTYTLDELVANSNSDCSKYEK